MGVMYELYGIPVYDDDIYHSGIKGMHWGIRRYQNPDGTLTPEGRKRYNVGSDGNLYDKETGKKYGLSTKAKIGIGAGAAALAGGAALAADQIFNGGRGRQAIGQFVGNTANKVGDWGQKAWGDAKETAGKVGDWGQKAWGDAKETASNLWNGREVEGPTVDGSSARIGGLRNVGGWIGDRAQEAWNGARDVAGDVGEWVDDRAQDVRDWATGDSANARYAAKNAEFYRNKAAEAMSGQGGWGQIQPERVEDFGSFFAGKAADYANRAEDLRQTSGLPGIVNGVQDWAQNAYNGVRTGIGNAANAVGDAAKDFWYGRGTGRVTPYGNEIRTGVGAKDVLNNVGEWIGDRAQDARTGIGNAANAVGDWAQNTYNNAKDTVSGWFNDPQQTVVRKTQGSSPLTTVSSNYDIPDVSRLMDSMRQQQAMDRFKKIGSAAAVGGTTAGTYGLTYNNAYEQAKKAGYSDGDAHRIAIGRAAGAGLTAALGTGIGAGLSANSSPIGAVGGTLAGGVIGGTVGAGLGSRAVQNNKAAQASGLGNVKIGQRVTLDNGQTGILAGFSTLPNGQVIPILE